MGCPHPCLEQVRFSGGLGRLIVKQRDRITVQPGFSRHVNYFEFVLAHQARQVTANHAYDAR